MFLGLKDYCMLYSNFSAKAENHLKTITNVTMWKLINILKGNSKERSFTFGETKVG